MISTHHSDVTIHFTYVDSALSNAIDASKFGGAQIYSKTGWISRVGYQQYHRGLDRMLDDV